VVNLMAVWRAHGLPRILRRCWAAGVVLAGASAGIRPGKRAWRVGPASGGGYAEEPIEPRTI
jgi:hypothetical protein